MTTTSLEASELSPPSQTEWVALGESIARAHARDQAAGLNSLSRDEFAEAIHEILAEWLKGETRLNYVTLRDWLSRSVTDLFQWQVHERQAADRWLSLEAKRFIADEVLRAGAREVSFILTAQADGMYGNAAVMMRGNRTGVNIRTKDIQDPRSLLLHNHPDGILDPSEADLNLATLVLGDRPECGFGIVSPGADRLYLIRDPRPAGPRLLS